MNVSCWSNEKSRPTCGPEITRKVTIINSKFNMHLANSKVQNAPIINFYELPNSKSEKAMGIPSLE